MKIITGGQSGADLAGNFFADKHNIPNEVNIFIGFKPINGESFPASTRINYVCNVNHYIGNLLCRTKYNIVNSDFTIILLKDNIDQTKGSKATFNICKKHNKSVVLFNIYTGFSELWLVEDLHVTHYSDASTHFSDIRFIFKEAKIINIAGQRDLNKDDAIKFLELILLG